MRIGKKLKERLQKFHVGDTVKVRTFEDMCAEYGVEEDEYGRYVKTPCDANIGYDEYLGLWGRKTIIENIDICGTVGLMPKTRKAHDDWMMDFDVFMIEPL